MEVREIRRYCDISDELRAEIVRLYMSGEKLAYIMAVSGIRYRIYIYNILHAEHIPLRPRRDIRAQRARARELRDQGYKKREIAEIMGVHRNTVRHLLNTRGRFLLSYNTSGEQPKNE